MKIVPCDREIFQLPVEQGRVAVQFHSYKEQIAIVELTPVACPVMGEGKRNLVGGEVFGIYEEIHTELTQNVAVFGNQELIVIYPGHGFLCSEFFCYGARRDIAGLIWCDRDIEVGVGYSYVAHTLEGGGRTVPCHEIVVGIYHVKSALVTVDQNNVLVFIGEHFRQVCANFSCSGYDYFHCIGLSECVGICLFKRFYCLDHGYGVDAAKLTQTVDRPM